MVFGRRGRWWVRIFWGCFGVLCFKGLWVWCFVIALVARWRREMVVCVWHDYIVVLEGIVSIEDIRAAGSSPVFMNISHEMSLDAGYENEKKVSGVN